MNFKSTKNNYPHLYRGKVLNNEDSLNIGRCKIFIPSLHGSSEISPDILPWARPITPSSYNERRGSYNIPDVGDVVWVLFEGGDINSPVYVGGTIGINDIPVDRNLVVLYEEDKDRISYDRNLKKFSIAVQGNQIDISPEHVEVKSQTPLVITSPNMVLEGNLEVSGDILIKGEFNIEQ